MNLRFLTSDKCKKLVKKSRSIGCFFRNFIQQHWLNMLWKQLSPSFYFLVSTSKFCLWNIRFICSVLKSINANACCQIWSNFSKKCLKSHWNVFLCLSKMAAVSDSGLSSFVQMWKLSMPGCFLSNLTKYCFPMSFKCSIFC